MAIFKDDSSWLTVAYNYWRLFSITLKLQWLTVTWLSSHVAAYGSQWHIYSDLRLSPNTMCCSDHPVFAYQSSSTDMLIKLLKRCLVRQTKCGWVHVKMVDVKWPDVNDTLSFTMLWTILLAKMYETNVSIGSWNIHWRIQWVYQPEVSEHGKG